MFSFFPKKEEAYINDNTNFVRFIENITSRQRNHR